MIDYIALLTELEQLTAALEAAVSHQHWDETNNLMLSRIKIMKILCEFPSADETIKQRVQEVAKSIIERELLLRSTVEKKKYETAHLLRTLLSASKASQQYLKNN